MKLNKKELNLIALVIGIWGIIFLTSGTIMNMKSKPIIHKQYSLDIETRKMSVAQAKKTEIKLKDITIEINNPISLNIDSYVEDSEKIDPNVLKNLVLDTSLVNINQAGTYAYIVKYNKKKYTGNIIVKEKELPNVTFTLKNLEFTLEKDENGTYKSITLSPNPSSYINEQLTEEVYNNLTIDLSQVVPNVVGTYTYSITYKNNTSTGTINILSPGPKVITPNVTNTEKNTTGILS